MTSVSGGSSTPPSNGQRTPSSPTGRAEPAPNDVRAMSDAFATARDRLERLPLPGGKKPTTGLRSRLEMAPEQRTAAGQTSTRGPIRQLAQHEGNEALPGWTGTGGMVTPPVIVAADAAAAHVDPGAFAQMLADLWTRENGKGAKEVIVRFGNRTWPATGARLIRNEAGALDVALLVGDSGRAYGDRMPQLEIALNAAGVNLGSLELLTDS